MAVNPIRKLCVTLHIIVVGTHVVCGIGQLIASSKQLERCWDLKGQLWLTERGLGAE